MTNLKSLTTRKGYSPRLVRLAEAILRREGRPIPPLLASELAKLEARGYWSGENGNS
jgi:hypothetical protein